MRARLALRIEAAVGLDGGSLVGELVVLDLVAKPLRIVAGLEVMLPGAVVDAFGDMQEHHQVLRLELQRAVRPAEVEAVVAEIAFGVFALVPLARLLADPRRRSSSAARRTTGSRTAPGRQAAARGLPERLRRPRRRSCAITLSASGPSAITVSDTRQHVWRNEIGMHGDQDGGGQRLGRASAPSRAAGIR